MESQHREFEKTSLGWLGFVACFFIFSPFVGYVGVDTYYFSSNAFL